MSKQKVYTDENNRIPSVLMPTTVVTTNTAQTITANKSFTTADIGQMRFGLDILRENASDSDSAQLALNFTGFQGGTTRFRNTNIYDGKANLIMNAAGQTRTINVYGDLSFALDFRLGLRVNNINQTNRNNLTTPGTTGNGFIIYNTTTNTVQKYENNTWSDIAYSGKDVSAIRVVTTGATDSLTTADHIVVIRKATGSATAVQLPTISGLAVGSEFIIVDGKGDAATNNITVTVSGGGNINGATSNVITTNRASVTYVYDGTEYVII